jgi:hypothetical protein
VRCLLDALALLALIHPSGSRRVSACEEYLVATVGRSGKEKGERDVIVDG